MAEDGVVGQYAGSQAREVLLTMEQWAARNGTAPLPPDPAPRKLTIKPHATVVAPAAPGLCEADEEIDREEAFADADDEEYDESEEGDDESDEGDEATDDDVDESWDEEEASDDDADLEDDEDA
jgi:hypothetical protein